MSHAGNRRAVAERIAEAWAGVKDLPPDDAVVLLDEADEHAELSRRSLCLLAGLRAGYRPHPATWRLAVYLIRNSSTIRAHAIPVQENGS